MNVAVLIPAYQPALVLAEVVRDLRERGLKRIVIVDDGSHPSTAALFEEAAACGAHIVHHAVNLGKGAALRTGFNYILLHCPEVLGVVTADADGQHHPEDIVRIAEALEAKPGTLTLGVRTFDATVPLRSRLGNTITRWIVRAVIGSSLSDTQTGLRGIPLALIPYLLLIPASGYEFELDMLITARHHSFLIGQLAIRTIYEPGNRSSHFSPLRDSMRIYMVLFRFTLLSIVTAIVDNLVFFAVFRASGSVPLAQAAGRISAVAINYQAARRAVFLSNERHRTTLPKFLALVAANGLISYALIRWITTVLPFSVLEAKLLAEGLLFIGNFVIQRDLIFTRRRPDDPSFAERLTRRVTEYLETSRR